MNIKVNDICKIVKYPDWKIQNFTQYIIFKLNFAHTFSHLYFYILIFDQPVDIELANAYEQGTHVLMNDMMIQIDV
jgi:hypothetical protein